MHRRMELHELDVADRRVPHAWRWRSRRRSPPAGSTSTRTPARSRRSPAPRREPLRRRPTSPSRRRRAWRRGCRRPGASRRLPSRRRRRGRTPARAPRRRRRAPTGRASAAPRRRCGRRPSGRCDGGCGHLPGRAPAVAVVPGGIEGGTETHEVADRRRRLGDELADDRLVAQPGTGGERVADVVLQRVGRVEHGGQPALGPRRRAGGERRPWSRSRRCARDEPPGRRPARRPPSRRRRRRPRAPSRCWRGSSRSDFIAGRGTARRQRTSFGGRRRACRWRSSAPPTLWRARRCRRARRPRRRRRAATAATWRA